MTERLRACIAFARFAGEHKIEPPDLADLLALACAAFRAGEREANTGATADRQRERFERKAESLGFGVQWPGLWPTLSRANVTIFLPEV